MGGGNGVGFIKVFSSIFFYHKNFTFIAKISRVNLGRRGDIKGYHLLYVSVSKACIPSLHVEKFVWVGSCV